MDKARQHLYKSCLAFTIIVLFFLAIIKRKNCLISLFSINALPLRLNGLDEYFV